MARTCCLLTLTKFRKNWSLTLCWHSSKKWRTLDICLCVLYVMLNCQYFCNIAICKLVVMYHRESWCYTHLKKLSLWYFYNKWCHKRSHTLFLKIKTPKGQSLLFVKSWKRFIYKFWFLWDQLNLWTIWNWPRVKWPCRDWECEDAIARECLLLTLFFLTTSSYPRLESLFTS